MAASLLQTSRTLTVWVMTHAIDFPTMDVIAAARIATTHEYVETVAMMQGFREKLARLRRRRQDKWSQ